MKLLLSLLFILTFTITGFSQNKGLIFDGVDDEVLLCDSDDYNIGDAFTIEAWIRAETWKNLSWQGSIVNKDQTAPNSGFAFRAGQDGTLSFTLNADGVWPEIVSDPIMLENLWYHVAATVEGKTMTIYINGIPMASSVYEGTHVVNDTPLHIGSSGFAGRHFEGGIDEVRVWNVARTSAELLANKNVPLNGDEPGLVTYCNFDEGSGPTLGNQVGCDGNIDGAVWADGWIVPEIDMGVVSINSPDILSLYERAVKVNVTLQNFGSEAVSDIPVSLLVNGLPALEDVYTGTIEAGEQADFTFETPLFVIENNTNLLTATTTLSEDPNQLNNSTAYRYRKPSSGNLVTVLNEEQHNIGQQTIRTSINMPENMQEFSQILFHFDLECPTGGCDPWDQPAKFSIITEDEKAYEIVRYVTPYGQGCGPWTVDVTDFKTIMDGPVSLESFIQVWGPSGWLVNADIEFITADEPIYQNLHSLWENDYLAYGDPEKDDDLPEVTVNYHSEVQNSHMRMTISGHGQGNTNNAAEFSNFTHDVVVNGAVDFGHNLWKNDCGDNPCANQAGTWTTSRAGWCPGQEVRPFVYNLEDVTTPGGSVALDYQLQDYTNLLNTDYNGGSHTEPHYRIHGFLIESSSNFLYTRTNLRARSISIATNNDPGNPSYDEISMSIVNNGSEPVTNPMVSYIVNDVIQVSEMYSGTIAAGEIVSHTFSSVSGFTGGEDHLVFGVVTAQGDENINDDVSTNFINSNLVNSKELENSIISIYPNPTAGAFNIEVENTLMEGSLSIFNVEGKLVHQQTIGSLNTRVELDTPGLYNVKLTNKKGEAIYKKLIVL